MRGTFRAAALVLVLVVASVISGCSDTSGDAKEEQEELRLSLGFLQGDLDAAQRRCVERELIAKVEDIDDFSEKMRRVDAGEIELADLPAKDEEALTAAITTCAVPGG
jgi:hypothetical protein